MQRGAFRAAEGQAQVGGAGVDVRRVQADQHVSPPFPGRPADRSSPRRGAARSPRATSQPASPYASKDEPRAARAPGSRGSASCRAGRGRCSRWRCTGPGRTPPRCSGGRRSRASVRPGSRWPPARLVQSTSSRSGSSSTESQRLSPRRRRRAGAPPSSSRPRPGAPSRAPCTTRARISTMSPGLSRRGSPRSASASRSAERVTRRRRRASALTRPLSQAITATTIPATPTRHPSVVTSYATEPFTRPPPQGASAGTVTTARNAWVKSWTLSIRQLPTWPASRSAAYSPSVVRPIRQPENVVNSPVVVAQRRPRRPPGGRVDLPPAASPRTPGRPANLAAAASRPARGPASGCAPQPLLDPPVRLGRGQHLPRQPHPAEGEGVRAVEFPRRLSSQFPLSRIPSCLHYVPTPRRPCHPARASRAAAMARGRPGLRGRAFAGWGGSAGGDRQGLLGVGQVDAAPCRRRGSSPASSALASWSPIADCTSRRSGRAP